MIRLTLLFSLLCGVTYAQTQTLLMEKTKGEVGFLAIGRPSALKIRGKALADESTSGQLNFSDRNVSGTVKVKLSAFETGIELRDRHMKEKYLEVAKFPEAALEIENLALPESFNKGDVLLKDIPFRGQFFVHGQKHPVSGTTAIEKSEKTKQVGFTITFSTRVSDYAIPAPDYMGIKVADEVIISAFVSGPLE